MKTLNNENKNLKNGSEINFADIPEWSDQKTLSLLLGKSESWFERCRWSKTGISFTKIGRTPMYSREAVLAYLESRTVKTMEEEK